MTSTCSLYKNLVIGTKEEICVLLLYSVVNISTKLTKPFTFNSGLSFIIDFRLTLNE